MYGKCIPPRSVLAPGSEQASNSPPPNITLNGPASIILLQGQPYDFCTASNTLSDACDRGATANDTIDGRLDNAIRFCGFPTYQDPTAAKKIAVPPVSLACNITTNIPGIYQVNFNITNSARMMSSVLRTVIVQAVCNSGEHLCDDLVSHRLSNDDLVSHRLSNGIRNDLHHGQSASCHFPLCSSLRPKARCHSNCHPQISCSQNGHCVSELQASNSSTLNQTILPVITLQALPQPYGTGVIQIKRGGSYSWCNGTSPTSASLCEPGVLAFDPNLPSGQQNVTNSVVVCPRADCLVGNGCSPQVIFLCRYG